MLRSYRIRFRPSGFMFAVAALACSTWFLLAAPASAGGEPAPEGLRGIVRAGFAQVDMDEKETGFTFAGGIEYRAGARAGLGAVYEFISFKVPDPVLSPSSLKMNALSGYLSIYLFPGKRFVPYATGGVMLFFSERLSDDAAGSLSPIGFDTTREASSSAGFAVGGGVEIAAGRKGAVDFNVRYMKTDLDANLSITDVVTGLSADSQRTLDLKAMLYTFGYSFSF